MGEGNPLTDNLSLNEVGLGEPDKGTDDKLKGLGGTSGVAGNEGPDHLVPAGPFSSKGDKYPVDNPVYHAGDEDGQKSGRLPSEGEFDNLPFSTEPGTEEVGVVSGTERQFTRVAEVKAFEGGNPYYPSKPFEKGKAGDREPPSNQPHPRTYRDTGGFIKGIREKKILGKEGSDVTDNNLD